MSDMSGEFMENCGFEGKMLCEVVQQYAPCDNRNTTTSEQLAEIEAQAEDTPATEYTPPERWRVLAVGEVLQAGDMWVNHEGEPWPTKRVGEKVNDERYIRRVEPQPEPVQVREGRWRTRGGDIKNIRPCEPLKGAYYVWPWTDGFMTFQDNGRHQGSQESPHDLVEYIGPIEPDKTQELETITQELPAEYTPPEGWRVLRYGEVLQPGDVWVNWEGTQSRPDIQHGDGATVSGGRYIRNIDIELQTVQNQLGESRQRVTQLEELVASLRTINEGAEKAVSGAGAVNDSLRLQLEAVKAELASVAADRQKLQIELDAAQQVPADSPELRQLRADLADMTLDRDQYKDACTRLSAFVDTARETAKAEAVEAIVEWLVPIRTCGSQALATAVIRNLPHIMRSVTGLVDEEID